LIVDLEEGARTLGGRPLTVFRTIIIPLTKYSIFAGTIMMFARSVDETGATTAVVTTLKTVPVLLVSWVKHTSIPEATPMDIALGAGILVLFSFVILLILRLAVKGGRYNA